MKKLFIMISLLALCGCTRVNEAGTSDEVVSNEELTEVDPVQHTLECTKDSDSMSFTALGDEVKQQTQVFDLTYEDLGISPDLAHDELINAINASLAEQYAALAGVEAVGALEDGHVRVTVTIDYDQADIQALIDAGLLHEGEVETKYVSLKKTQDQLRSDGFACTIQ